MGSQVSRPGGWLGNVMCGEIKPQTLAGHVLHHLLNHVPKPKVGPFELLLEELAPNYSVVPSPCLSSSFCSFLNCFWTLHVGSHSLVYSAPSVFYVGLLDMRSQLKCHFFKKDFHSIQNCLLYLSPVTPTKNFIVSFIEMMHLSWLVSLHITHRGDLSGVEIIFCFVDWSISTHLAWIVSPSHWVGWLVCSLFVCQPEHKKGSCQFKLHLYPSTRPVPSKWRYSWNICWVINWYIHHHRLEAFDLLQVQLIKKSTWMLSLQIFSYFVALDFWKHIFGKHL